MVLLKMGKRWFPVLWGEVSSHSAYALQSGEFYEKSVSGEGQL